MERRDSPSGKTPDGIFRQAGLAVFALRAAETIMPANKNIAAPFESQRQEAVPAAPYSVPIKKPCFIRRVFKLVRSRRDSNPRSLP